MADVSHLQEDDDNDHRHDVLLSISPQNNHLPHHLHQFDLHPLDLDFSSSQNFLHLRTRRFDRTPPPISSLDRDNQVNFVIDMFHQRVEQLRSQSRPQPSRSIEENRLFRSDRGFRVIEENDDIISNEFDVDFESGSGFLHENCYNPNSDDDDNSGFVVADSGDSDEAGESETNEVVAGPRSESGDSSQVSGSPEISISGLRVTDIVSDSDGGCDEEASFQLGWDAFHLEDDITELNPNENPNPNSNEDFEWEEVDDRIDERETLSMFFGAEPDDDASVLPVLLSAFEEPTEEHDALEWQVLSNVHSFEPNTELEDQHDEYNYTEYEMFFGQFADSDVPSSGRPPASKPVVDNLSTVLITQEDDVQNSILCAVCKDEVVVGEKATQLPCSHGFHGDCILPWLAIRNTCPVCRHELPTDDLDYERRKAERGGLAL